MWVTIGHKATVSGLAIGGGGGGGGGKRAASPLVGFCYHHLEIYKSVIFRNRPILDNRDFLSLMCICCFITISEVNLL